MTRKLRARKAIRPPPAPRRAQPSRPAATDSRPILSTDLRRTTGHLVAQVSGEVDRDNADDLRHTLTDALARADGRNLHVDMARVTFCDSSGLHALLAVRTRAEDTATELSLEPGAYVDRLLDLTGTRSLFHVAHVPTTPDHPDVWTA